MSIQADPRVMRMTVGSVPNSASAHTQVGVSCVWGVSCTFFFRRGGGVSWACSRSFVASSFASLVWLATIAVIRAVGDANAAMRRGFSITLGMLHQQLSVGLLLSEI